MSLLKVNDIQRATSGSNAVVFTDPVIITTGSISASVVTIGTLTSSLLRDGDIPKEKLTNDARDWVNIFNKPAGLISSSAQFATSISGSSLALADVTSSGVIKTTGQFSGSGAALFGIPNAGLVNNSITINGTSVSLGGTRNIVTSEVSESGNLYYTDARVKAKLSVETVVSSSGQVNYQSITGQPSVNTLGSDGNKSFTITAGVFLTGSTGIDVTTDSANAKIVLRTVGGTVSSSAQVQAALPANVVSSSTQVQPLLPGGTVSSSAQFPGWVTASSQIDYNSIQNKLSGVVSSSTQVQPLLPANTVSASAQVKTLLPDGTVSASAQYPGWITSSTQVVQSLPVGTVSASSQFPGWVTASSQIVVQNTTGIGAIATTGSNIFNGNQTVSGSVTLTGNLTVQGTSSVLYVTSSQLNVGSNSITLNTDTILRYGGLAVYDSASLTNQSGSLLWDSVNNVWLFVHAGTSNTSSIIITGPENTGALGSEQFLTPNLLPKAGLSGDHIVNSQISDNGTQVGIVGGLKVTGSITSSHIVPSVTDTFDLGSPTLKFRDLYLSGSTLYLGSLAIRDNGGSLSVGPSGSAIGTNSPVSGAFTGSFQGNGSQLTNISNAALPGGVVSSSTQLPAGTVSSSAQYPGWVTASSQIDYNSITNKLSGVYSSSTQVAANLPAGTVSSSGQINAGATANFATAVAAQLGTVHSGSFLGTATTNNLAEGFTNLYYTDARVKTKLDSDVVHSGSFLGTATTTNLTEGTNLYFTNARVLTYVDSLGVYSSSAQVKNNLPAGTVSSSAQIAPVLVTSASYAATASLALGVSGSLAVNTDGLSEGIVNLYYTDARVKTKLNADNVHSASFLGTATTTNLTEGVNLYFTNQRVINALPIGTVSSSTQLGAGLISSSTQFKTLTDPFTGSFFGSLNGQFTGSILSAGVVSASAQYPGWVTASSQIDYNNITNKLSGVVSASQQIVPLLPTGTVSSSGQIDYNSIQNKLSGVYSSSAQTVAAIANQTIAPTTINATSVTASFSGSGIGLFFVNYNTLSNIPANIVSSSTQVSTFLPGGTVSASAQYPGWVTASSQVNITATTGYTTFSSSLATLDTTQQISINSLNAATSSYAINSTIQSQLANVISSSAQTVASISGQTIAPTTVNATNVTASALTPNQAVFTNASDGLVSNAITGTGNVVMSASPTLTGTVTANNMILSGSQFSGIVSGSGTQYRLVVPVGTNLYAT
jgi:hypothetical protein